MKNITYSDVLEMPTHERRFFLGLLTKDAVKKQEKMEEINEQAKTTTGKGKRSTRMSGSALKNNMQSGKIPLT